MAKVSFDMETTIASTGRRRGDPPSCETFGVHLMLDCYLADPIRLSDEDMLSSMLMELVGKLGMHAIHRPVVLEVGPMNRKDPGGLSGFVLIAESHISFHTFPKRRFVSVDVYTCQDSLPEGDLIEEFRRYFSFEYHESFVQRRGTRYPTCNLLD
jgi:S-adenosylmethionine decarboxylase